MSRARAKFTEADIRRALRAAKHEGAALEVETRPDGGVVLKFSPQSTGEADKPVATGERVPL